MSKGKDWVQFVEEMLNQLERRVATYNKDVDSLSRKVDYLAHQVESKPNKPDFKTYAAKAVRSDGGMAVVFYGHRMHIDYNQNPNHSRVDLAVVNYHYDRDAVELEIIKGTPGVTTPTLLWNNYLRQYPVAKITIHPYMQALNECNIELI